MACIVLMSYSVARHVSDNCGLTGTCEPKNALLRQTVPNISDFDFQSGVRLRFDVGYLCATFTLPRPVGQRLDLNIIFTLSL